MGLFNRKNKKVDEELMLAQRERIEILKAEVRRLEGELQVYRAKENSITETLNYAREKAENYEREARLRFSLEQERLSAYREKWTKRLKNLKDAERLGEEILECNEYFSRIAKELKDIVRGDEEVNEPNENYITEIKRLKEIGVSSEEEITLSEEDLTKLLLQFKD